MTLRQPLTDTEKQALLEMVRAKEEIDRLRKVIAHALKALDLGDVQHGRQLLFNAL